MKNNRSNYTYYTMVDLTQRKLTKSEWSNIEIQLPEAELDILKLLLASYHDTGFYFQ